MPIQFAKAASRQAHVDARYLCGGRQFALRHLMGPAALLNSLVRQIIGVPNGTDISPDPSAEVCLSWDSRPEVA
jgi:hypothetical protein